MVILNDEDDSTRPINVPPTKAEAIDNYITSISHGTRAYGIDVIRIWLQSQVDQVKIIDSFLGNPTGTFLIDPTKDNRILDVALAWNEDFPAMVKVAIIDLLQNRIVMDTTIPDRFQKKDAIVKHLEKMKVVITDMQHVTLRNLGPKYEGVPIATDCQILMLKKPQTYTKRAVYSCLSDHTETVYASLITKTLPQKVICWKTNCDHYKEDMYLVPGSKVTSFVMRGIVQEPLEQAKHSQPITRDVEFKDDEVTQVYIGQQIKLIGNFRSIETETGYNDIVIQVINIDAPADTEPVMPSAQTLAKWEKLVKQVDYLDQIAKSFQPLIYPSKVNGTWLAKIAVVLHILGGIKIDGLRGDIHVFIGGDPSSGKTKIGEYLEEVTVKSDFVNCSTASGAGLTVGMDPELHFPRAGPAVLCHNGNLVCDEFTRFKDKEDYDKFLQSMESQFVTYTKGGHHQKLAAATSYLALGNPKNDQYDFDFGILDNYAMPKALMARFDIKINIVDVVNAVEDGLKIDHVNLLRDIGVQKFIEQNGLFTAPEMLAMFNYMKTIEPEMLPESAQAIKSFWQDMRGMQHAKGAVRLDIRFYEAIYRTATAWARLHLSKQVTMQYVSDTIKFYKETLKTFGMNTERELHQLPLTDAAQNKDIAFERTWRLQEKLQDNEYIDEAKFLAALHKEYPYHFPGGIDEVQDMFDKWHRQKKITKLHGKYKLG